MPWVRKYKGQKAAPAKVAPANRQQAAPDSEPPWLRKRPTASSGSSNAAASGASKRSRQEAVPTSGTAKRCRTTSTADDIDVLMTRLPLPGGASDTGELEVNIPVPNIDEYRDAESRPIRNRTLFTEGGGASHDTPPLVGHDVLEHMLSWNSQPTQRLDGQPAARRPPAQYACWQIMQEHKKAKKVFQDSIDDSDETICSLSVGGYYREDTSNWQREPRGENWRFRPTGAVERADEIQAIIKQHDGEARVWQTGREEWVPLVEESVLSTIPSVKVDRRAPQ